MEGNCCSRILYNKIPGCVVCSRTLDWDVPLGDELWIFPKGLQVDGGADKPVAKWTSKYGSLVVQAMRYEDAGIEGINEVGLAAHLLYLDDTDYGTRDARPGVSYGKWVRYLLDNFATVEDAVEGMKEIQITPTQIHGTVYPVHVVIEDASGDSAIFEILEGVLNVHRGPEYCVLTNEPPLRAQLIQLKKYTTFGGDEPIPGNTNSEDRFVRASYFLNYLPKLEDQREAAVYSFSLISTVQVPFGAPHGSTTLWSSVTDLSSRVYYFRSTFSTNIIWVELKNVDFSLGANVQKVDPADPALFGEISHVFSPTFEPISTASGPQLPDHTQGCRQKIPL